MIKQGILRILALAGLLWAQQGTAVTLQEWGTSAGSASADCSLLNCSKLDFLFTNPIIPGAASGGLHQTVAELLDYADPDGRGTVSARAEVLGGLSVPKLQARAASTDGDGWVSGLAMGIQAFEFTGVDGSTVGLDASLTGSVSNPDGSDVTGLGVGIWLLHGNPLFTFPDAASSLAELLAQVFVLPVADSLDWENLSTGAVNRSTTTTDPGDHLEIALDHGDEFYLMAALTAGAVGSGAVADSFSTLEMNFDTVELAPATVPLPAGLWLFGSGMLALIGVARRGRR